MLSDILSSGEYFGTSVAVPLETSWLGFLECRLGIAFVAAAVMLSCSLGAPGTQIVHFSEP